MREITQYYAKLHRDIKLTCFVFFRLSHVLILNAVQYSKPLSLSEAKAEIPRLETGCKEVIRSVFIYCSSIVVKALTLPYL